MKQLYKIEVASGLEYESIAECGLGLKLNDKVVVQCERYLDFAKVSKICGDPILDEAEFERQRAMNTKGRHIEGQKTMTSRHLPPTTRRLNASRRTVWK